MKKDLMNACMISDIVSRLPPLIAHKWAELKITKKMEIKVLKNNLVIYFRFFRSTRCPKKSVPCFQSFC